MVEYCRSIGHTALAVGINPYFTKQSGKEYIQAKHLRWADLVLVVSHTHVAYVNGMLNVMRRKRKVRVIDLSKHLASNQHPDIRSWYTSVIYEKLRKVRALHSGTLTRKR